MLRCNTARGFATVIAEEISSGGKQIVRVLLDSNGEERVFLRVFVSESDTPVPEAAKTVRKRKPRKSKTEIVSDDLLIERAPAGILPALDPLPDDRADYDDIGADLPESNSELEATI